MLKATSSPLRGLHLDLGLMERMKKHCFMCATQEMTGFRQVFEPVDIENDSDLLSVYLKVLS
jgi:hypothetical protein